jgi:hypothetical protein
VAGEKQVHLVIQCQSPPTVEFLDDVVEKLGPKLGNGYRVDLLQEECGFGITSPTNVEIVVRLACLSLRPENRRV